MIIAASVAAAIVVLGLIAIGLFHQHGYQQYAADHTAEYAKYAEQKAGEACRGVAAEQLVHCFSEARVEAELEKQSYEHDQADLVAQRKAALWAEMMGGAAVVGMGLSIVGVFLVWITFVATREGNKITERIGEAQTRCYLRVTNVRVKIWKGSVPEIYCTIKNSGNSPARSLKIVHEIEYIILSKDTDTLGLDTGLSDMRGPEDTYEITAGDEFEVPKFPIADNFSDPVLRAFESKDYSLCIKVVVSLTWQDVFGVEDGLQSRWTGLVGDFQGTVFVLDRHENVRAQIRAERVNRQRAEDDENNG